MAEVNFVIIIECPLTTRCQVFHESVVENRINVVRIKLLLLLL